MPASTRSQAPPARGEVAFASLRFAPERRFWRRFCLLLFIIAVLKGLRRPSAWALTQAQMDYSHGFIKRGLQGAVFSLIGVHHVLPLTLYCFATLALLLALLFVLARRSGAEERFGSMLPVAVAASGYALTYLVHVIGYTDLPLGAVTVFLLLIERPRLRFLAALLLLPITLLVHENVLLMYLPVVLFSFFLDAITGPPSQRRGTLLMPAALALFAVAITLATSARPHLSPDEVDRFSDEIQARVDFDIRDDALNVLSRPLSGSLREGLDNLTVPVWRTYDLITLANILPAAILLAYFLRRMLRAALPDREGQRRLLWRAALLAMLAPLGLYALGVDGGRWNTASFMAEGMVFLLLCRKLPRASVQLSAAERNLALVVIAINLITGGGLFGEQRVNTFPFVPDIVHNFRNPQ